MDGPVSELDYRTLDVDVSGGTLRVGVWGSEDPAARTALLLHGVTASHRCWSFLARHLPGVRLVAPDLRGRGRSNEITGPAGMAAHADDAVAVLDALGIDRTVVVGHSMGAFATAVLGHRHPDRVRRQVFLDGGLPLDVPADLDPDAVIATVLGPTAERLAMRFADLDDYLAFWRSHPAFADDWSPDLEDYLAYDLVGQAPTLRPATSYATMAEDTVDLNGGRALVEALGALEVPTLFVTVPRGLLDEDPGLYAPDRVEALVASLQNVRHVRVEGVNHYTLVMSDRGAARVAEMLTDELAATIGA